MKYMLIMNTPHDGYDQYFAWPKDILEANTAFMISFAQKLSAAGELVSTEGLASPKQAKRVRVGKDGRPITDGVFPEAKEFLAGWWIIDVDSPQRAYELAAELSGAPGQAVKLPNGKLEEHFWIEVRQIMSSQEEMR